MIEFTSIWLTRIYIHYKIIIYIKLNWYCDNDIDTDWLTHWLTNEQQAALAAVITVSINGLISFSDLWEAFKHTKNDFIVMLVTLVITFVFETSYGLAIGKSRYTRYTF